MEMTKDTEDISFGKDKAQRVAFSFSLGKYPQQIPTILVLR